MDRIRRVSRLIVLIGMRWDNKLAAESNLGDEGEEEEKGRKLRTEEKRAVEWRREEGRKDVLFE